MKYLRAKHIRKSLRQYKYLCGINEPYKVILDGNFIAMCLEMNVDLYTRVSSFLQTDRCTFYITESAIAELEKLGLKEAVAMTLQMEKLINRELSKEDTAIGDEVSNVTKSILSVVGEKNKGKFFVATQESSLRAALREIPGVPLLYLNRSVLVFEDLSKATLRISRKAEQEKRAKLEPEEKKSLNILNHDAKKEAKLHAPQHVRRVKTAKGPNPLSCKKKTVKKVRSKKK